jgi:hypothetical protein
MKETKHDVEMRQRDGQCDMNHLDRRSNIPVSDLPHHAVYWIIIGLSAWLVLSAWGFFGGGYTGLVLTVVSLFILIAVAIPVVLWQIWRRHTPAAPDEPPTQSFAE